jgi:hypothetical protein
MNETQTETARETAILRSRPRVPIAMRASLGLLGLRQPRAEWGDVRPRARPVRLTGVRFCRCESGSCQPAAELVESRCPTG